MKLWIAVRGKTYARNENDRQNSEANERKLWAVGCCFSHIIQQTLYATKRQQAHTKKKNKEEKKKDEKLYKLTSKEKRNPKKNNTLSHTFQSAFRKVKQHSTDTEYNTVKNKNMERKEKQNKHIEREREKKNRKETKKNLTESK